ncbi:unnamed protein product [Taenia asiatica]|uniref:Protein kinase domain-containing protein n=1 Tax=Taenia asiatica TaxID=60517 RepID=A0A0R3WH40_TAEAS|nr:unnamed protein product [Taenia asiatica]
MMPSCDLSSLSRLEKIGKALRYCHARHIIHCDLKPQNVLDNVNRSVVKLADFGMARSFGYPLRALTHEVVTLLYRAPEILLGEAVYCCGVDVWSMGCMFAEMATGDPLFCGDSEVDQLYQIFRMKETPTEETWPGALLRYDPPSRINAQRALDIKSLPAIGEEYVGLPIGKIPSDFAELFNALINIDESGMEGEGEEWMKEGKETSDKMVVSVYYFFGEKCIQMVLLGASTYQVSAARARFAEEKSKNSETEKPQRTSDAKKPVAEPPSENHDVNKSLLDLPSVIPLHTPFGIFHANWWLSPDAITIIAVLVAHYEALSFINN